MPRTLAQNAQYIAETIKPAIKSAIEAQGVTVPSTDSFLDYADRIAEIEGGGSGYQLKDLPTGSISTVNDAAELPLNALKVSVEAVQDLHGYDHPWVGGAGKNKLRLLLSRLKSLNTGGTWNDNVYTYESITYTIIEDSDGNIVSIKVNGTTSTRSFLLLDDLSDMVGVDFIMNGCPNGGVSPYTASGYCLFTGGIGVPQTYDTGSGTSFTVSSYGALIYLNVNNTSVSNIIFYPMFRLATVSDPTFEPYSNICPIEGWDSGEITVRGKNLCSADISSFTPNVQWVDLEGDAAGTYRGTKFTLLAGTYFVKIHDIVNVFGLQVYNQVTENLDVTDLNGGSITLPSAGDIYIRVKAGVGVQTSFKTQIELGSTPTTYEPYQGKQYTQQFPQTIYGGSANLLTGEGVIDRISHTINDFSAWNYQGVNNYKALYIKLSDLDLPLADTSKVNLCAFDKSKHIANGYGQPYGTASLYAANNGTIYFWNNDDYYSGGNAMINGMNALGGVQIVYYLAEPIPFTFTPIPTTKMLQGTNNLYADCGEVIEGEYFVDEGAIDVRKVDYQIGSSGSIKTTDGRVLSGFASMSGYHARPLDASGNWLDVDWSKDWEIGIAFKLTSFSANQAIFASADANRELVPTILWVASDATGQNQLRVLVSTDGSSWEVACITSFVPTVNTFYFIKMKYESETKKCITQVTSDFINWTVIENDTLANHPYYNGAGTAIGGRGGSSSWATNNLLIDTFNTYIKGDGVNWGAFTGAFPS